MESSEKFWLAIWALVALVVITFVLTAATYNSRKDKLIAASPDPIATACALSDRISPVCLAHLGSQK